MTLQINEPLPNETIIFCANPACRISMEYEDLIRDPKTGSLKCPNCGLDDLQPEP